ncbi:MAG: VCBS repeat-containing protein, partial [Myxococcota bacterium]
TASILPAHEGLNSVAATDLNGDGVLDLVTANGGSHVVNVLLGRGDGSFEPPSFFAAGRFPRSVTVADLDVNCTPDVVVISNLGLSVLLNQRDPTLPVAECCDGIDNDGDGRIDFDPVTRANPGGVGVLPAGVGDPACASPDWFRGEDSQCQDGVNNDSKPGIDYDGGFFFGLSGPADPECKNPWDPKERRPGQCGLGFELGFLVPLLWVYRRRRRS